MDEMGTYMNIATPVVEIALRDFPGCRIILATWYFGHSGSGKWDKLEEKFNADPPHWVDYITASEKGGCSVFWSSCKARDTWHPTPVEFHRDQHMGHRSPWGAFGANPLLEHDQQVWALGEGITGGSLPYSRVSLTILRRSSTRSSTGTKTGRPVTRWMKMRARWKFSDVPSTNRTRTNEGIKCA